MTHAKRPQLALIISCLSLVGVGLIIWLVPPDHWWVESGMIILLTISLWLGAGWLVGKRKPAGLIVLFTVVTILLSRLGILSWITLGLWVAVIGLISLIN